MGRNCYKRQRNYKKMDNSVNNGMKLLEATKEL